MSGSSDALATVTLRVNRFTPRPERDRPARSGSPFAKKSSPFGGASASARRRPAASSGFRSTLCRFAGRIRCWTVC